MTVQDVIALAKAGFSVEQIAKLGEMEQPAQAEHAPIEQAQPAQAKPAQPAQAKPAQPAQAEPAQPAQAEPAQPAQAEPAQPPAEQASDKSDRVLSAIEKLTQTIQASNLKNTQIPEQDDQKILEGFLK